MGIQMDKWGCITGGFIMVLIPILFLSFHISMKEEEQELDSFTFKKSESPNLINIIEFREMTYTEDPYTVLYSMRIYYGKRGSILKKYKEFKPGNSPIDINDDFKIHWENDELVTIDAIRKNEKGESYLVETFKIDLSQ
jgi:hypothetical protein